MNPSLDLGSGYVPAFITEEIIFNLPTNSGNGIHDGLFRLAQKLSPWRSDSQIDNILRQYASAVDRHVPESEINSAIRCGRRYAWQGTASRSDSDPGTNDNTTHCASCPRTPKPKFNPEAFSKFISDHELVDADWLACRSPIRPDNRTPASFLHALYHKDEKIVVFDDYHSQGQEVWAHPGVPYDATSLNAFTNGKRLGVWYLANPVDGTFHLNDEDKPSRRSWQNVTCWRYMVVESDRDDISPTDWLTALAQLRLPIAAIYESGGRLAHALLRINAPNKEGWDRIRDLLLPLLVTIGADRGSLSAVRLSRLPCCQRLGKEDEHGTYRKFEDGPHFQQLLYLNAAPDGTPIIQQQVWPDPPEPPHSQDLHP
jgi:hypothetical protein